MNKATARKKEAVSSSLALAYAFRPSCGCGFHHSWRSAKAMNACMALFIEL